MELLVGGAPVRGEWIRIVRLPSGAGDFLESLGRSAPEAMTERKIADYAQSRACAARLHHLFGDLESRGARLRYAGAGINTRPANLPTCTINQNTDRYIGLHVDTFYSREIEMRPNSPARICCNLGSEERFLLFVNLTLSKMVGLLDDVGNQDPGRHDTGRGLAISFLTAFPHYPVTRIRLAPGEAYIAPTENMVHDGSTEGKREADITLTILGDFQPETF
jgi:hypothetical protein